MPKILIVGGYGTFGGRLVELLENEPAVQLIVAGRSVAKAEAFCKARPAGLIPATFDRTGDLSFQLRTLAPDIVVDTSGPFQDYGDDSYRLIDACIAQRINYLDLADGAVFVSGVHDFDDAARAAGVFVLSGVSSFPVLTALVVQELAAGISKIDTIRGGIAPSPYAGVGENVIRAVAGYAGQPVTVRKNGILTTAYPFTETHLYTIAPPGRVPLRRVLFSLVEVPDLKLLAGIWPGAQTVWMGAGPVPAILHRALIGLSWLVRWKILPSLSPFTKLIRFVMNNIRWGEHRGGMFVEITGTDAANQTVRKSWHLLAEGRDGPLIPCMAVEALIRKLIAGAIIAPGARTAIADLSLADYDGLFAQRAIYTGFRSDAPKQVLPLYADILGDAWHRLPLAIKSMHDFDKSSRATGKASVTRGTGFLSRLVAKFVGFPAASSDIAVTVEFAEASGVETWTRTFGKKSFFSKQYRGHGKSERLLTERFGPLSFAMALVLEDDVRLRLVLRGWRLLGMPLPLRLAPRSDSFETVEDGRFCFNVEISHLLTGLIVHYRGWLEKE